MLDLMNHLGHPEVCVYARAMQFLHVVVLDSFIIRMHVSCFFTFCVEGCEESRLCVCWHAIKCALYMSAAKDHTKYTDMMLLVTLRNIIFTRRLLQLPPKF